MPVLRDSIMSNLYGGDIWAGFTPRATDKLQGWNGDHPSLGRLASLPGKNLVADVGVWKGMSTINMALAMRDANIDGCVIAIDTFLGSPEHWDAGLFERTHGLPDLFWTFMSNVFNAGVAEYIIPMPQTSVTAAMILNKKGICPSIIHIDAAHEFEEVIRDAIDYYSILQPGGYLIGDDYHITWPGVVKAAGKFSSEIGVPLLIEFPKWIIQKPAR